MPKLSPPHPDLLAAERALLGAPASAPPRKSSLPVGLVRTARPRQWAKNVLVAAAPGAAGVLADGAVLASVALAFVAFCLVASATYFVNDAADAEADRRHPTKRHRPVAAGVVPRRLAVAVGIGLMLAGFGCALVVSPALLGVVVLYVALTSAYTIRLKHVAVLDITVVAAGFVIRAAAGGVAASVPLSRWFLIVASFGSLFMVAGKRYGEFLELGEGRGATRATLTAYTRDYLRYVWTLASGVTLTAYCLWAFEQSEADPGGAWYELSIIPFVLGLLRYALLVERGKGGAPEDLVLGDRPLQLIGLVWLAVFAAGVYLGG